MSGYRVWPHEGRLPEAVPGTLHLYQTASTIICHDPAGIPPMLETGEIAAASVHALLADDATIAEHTEARRQHRGLISGTPRPDIVCYLHEAGLRRLRGDKHLRHAQFLVLATLRDDARIQVRVVPEALEYLVPRDAFSIVRCSDGREVVVASMQTATLTLDGEEHLASYRDLHAMLDKAALSTAESSALILGLPVPPEPVLLAAKEFADEANHAPVEERSAPSRNVSAPFCARWSTRTAISPRTRSAPRRISRAPTRPVMSRRCSVTAWLPRYGGATPQTGPSRTPRAGPIPSPPRDWLICTRTTSPTGVVPGRRLAGAKRIAQRSNFFQNQLRDILFVLARAGGYQTIDEVAEATAFWDEQAGHRLGLLLKERMVALLVGHYEKEGLPVRDSRVKSYTITSAGLAYLQAAPPGENRETSIETRRAERELPKSERHRAVRLRMNAADPRPATGTTSHTSAGSRTMGKTKPAQRHKDAQ